MSDTPIPYEVLGGEPALRALVDQFYDLMNTMPEYYVIRKLHPEDLSGSRDKLFMFLSGWLGGPPLYVAQYGHPRLRMRHFPFAIGMAERDAWIACMQQALNACGINDDFKTWLMQSLFQTADWMRNKEEG